MRKTGTTKLLMCAAGLLLGSCASLPRLEESSVAVRIELDDYLQVLQTVDIEIGGRDWPFLFDTAGGATWVSLHHGGGVGMGYSQHSGVVIVCDGSDAAAKRIERVLWNDPGTGVMRHADAGYDIAVACAEEQGLKLPMINAATGA